MSAILVGGAVIVAMAAGLALSRGLLSLLLNFIPSAPHLRPPGSDPS